MSKFHLTGNLAITLAVLTPAALAPATARAAITHPHPMWYGNTQLVPPGKPVGAFASGVIKLEGTFGTLECFNLFFGDAWNETEPEGATERGYGEILGWSATGWENIEGKDWSARCHVSLAGAEAYVVDESPITKKKEHAGGKVVIKQLIFGRRTPPWKLEGETSEIERRETFMLRVGMPEVANASKTRGGGYHRECYPGETEIENPPATIEKVQIPAPQGCTRFTVVINDETPPMHLEIPFQGTIRARLINGGPNCLTPTKGELHPAEAGELESQGLGPGRLTALVGQQATLKGCGFLNEENLTLGLPG